MLQRRCKVGELREGPTYRPGEAVERAGQVAGWRAMRTAINGARGIVEWRGARFAAVM